MRAKTNTRPDGWNSEDTTEPDQPARRPGCGSPPDEILVCGGFDHTPRWREGERLEHLFEDQCDRMRENGLAGQVAVDAGQHPDPRTTNDPGPRVASADPSDRSLRSRSDGTPAGPQHPRHRFGNGPGTRIVLTYDQLDAWANQLARHLLTRGARPGDRIGLLFDEATYSYVGMLAILKINAAYVPLDVTFPDDRLSYIVRDAGVRTVLSLSYIRDRRPDVGATLLCVDEAQALVAAEDDGRLSAEEKGEPVDELCYIIYTSGSTGRPKGVAIEHASICNFVRVAAEVYGIEPTDRVYQGMTIAFDFSVEEIWVPLAAGATLVPKPGGPSLLGPELQDFLQENGVTALCCVPTLLATLEEFPDLRFLLVSGEACPQDLVTRWHRPGRRFLNVYGPTEATVSATWTPLHLDRPVTIGVPLPTYSVVILDPTGEKALPVGDLGEIGIAGIGLAAGYVNRDDLTEQAFIHDFLGIKNNPSARIYRTGDLGRINDDGEIEYHGRMDDQVKIRGYRIELTEIESTLLQVPGIAQAVVDTYETQPGLVELVAYYSLSGETASPDPAFLHEQLRSRLPAYMVPAYFTELAAIPTLPSDKADRKNLPAPKGARNLAAQQAHTDPTTDTEKILAEVLADVTGLDRVSTEAHFFDDLGANSLLMARFCSRARQWGQAFVVSMRDVYLHPTIRSLAAALELDDVVNAETVPAGAVPAGIGTQLPEPRHGVPAPETAPHPATPASTTRYVRCGILQLLFFLGYIYAYALLGTKAYTLIFADAGFTSVYPRAIIFGGAGFILLCAAPIAAKWALVGRWKPGEIPLWSLAYVRFWAVKILIRSNPLALFAGSPLYTFYLRLLGARIGRGVVIFSRTVPVCTDLLTIGDSTVIRKDSSFTCYRAEAGVIQTGPVTIGKDVFVGEKTVLDIDTSLGDGTQLGHASSLHARQAVPDGERWHGSPAQPCDVDYRTVTPARCTTRRRATYGTLQLLNVLLLSLPLSAGALDALLLEYLKMHVGERDFASWGFYRDHLAVSSILFFVPLAAGLTVAITVPRLLKAALAPGQVHPLYGFRYSVQRMIARMTNRKFFMDLFGDSSYIVGYLRALGYNLTQVVQTGTNFGTELQHETPFQCVIGSGTMISDALSIMSTDFSDTSFRVSTVPIGRDNFLGNNIAFPPGARTGDNCLLATKVMIPLSGEVREGVGLLGSPCFEIPRSVERDSRFDHLKTGDEFRRRLAAKNRHNRHTIGIFLFVRWVQFFGITLIMLAGIGMYGRFGAVAVATAAAIATMFGILYSVLVERAATGFHPLRPQLCSIYEPYFWRHERIWKLIATAPFNGTPFKNVIWRLLGVRIGHRVFDDGCAIPEKTLVTLGNDCILNAGSVIQCHSLEDGTFKSDYTVIGAGCTLGVETFVHYGVTMGDGARLDADSFLMKGEEVAPRARWRGNPAGEARVPRQRTEPTTDIRRYPDGEIS